LKQFQQDDGEGNYPDETEQAGGRRAPQTNKHVVEIETLLCSRIKLVSVAPIILVLLRYTVHPEYLIVNLFFQGKPTGSHARQPTINFSRRKSLCKWRAFT
jgi:hypothetical protein